MQEDELREDWQRAERERAQASKEFGDAQAKYIAARKREEHAWLRLQAYLERPASEVGEGL